MNQTELFYWAYEHYKKEFENNRDDYLFKKGINSKKYPNDQIKMIEVKCEIEEDWIAAIEKGLIYIAKAIKEDRQFIRNDGDVLPIEKVRRVSKDSITDLSKHSNYITRLPEEENDNIVPEKLLMIKRENDYTIYENRVVYTTLSYLKEFVSSRLEKIKEATNKYEGSCKIEKKIDLGYRSIDFVLNLAEVRKNDPIFVENNSHLDKIQRLDLILNDVLVLLKTPLMQEVSKAPLVTRPVTKTNVLKMNTNFKETLAVFDYVCAYNKPGYSITEEEKIISPLSKEQEDAFNDVIQLSSFLAYEFNNRLEDKLKEAYILEEKRRQKIADDEILARIQELMDKARKSEKEIGEYLLVLEEGYKILEKRLEEAKEETQRVIQEYEKKIEEINIAHQEEIDNLNKLHEEEIVKLEQSHREEVDSIKEVHEQEINALNTECDAKIEEVRNAYKIEADKDKETISSLNNQISENEKAAKEREQVQNELLARYKKDLDLSRAELLALRIKEGKPKIDPADFTSKERFDELEQEKMVLDAFFEKAWDATKKEIRKKHLKIEKKKKGDK